MEKLIIKTIKFYQSTRHQFWTSFLTPIQSQCRFYPSCSDYTLLVIEKYGVMKGAQKGLIRALRCNPWSQGGIDLP